MAPPQPALLLHKVARYRLALHQLVQPRMVRVNLRIHLVRRRQCGRAFPYLRHCHAGQVCDPHEAGWICEIVQERNRVGVLYWEDVLEQAREGLAV